jgi:hypothetical protein
MATNDDSNIPQIVKTISYFIKQVGFPIVAFLLMFYMTFYSVQKLTDSVNNQTKVLAELTLSMKSFQGEVKSEHKDMTNKFDTIIMRKIP